ncbi:WD40 repeat domain-containing protein [Stieleria mannarensis]|uniref:WD40 repeat domain-containing protein n=1 Tax=Stieleria mannarensis TaxID=2755585 RepID=UPI0015FF3272|nr:WD40 repeat domain-containing protein [Rhodopirellula sp. JC639]
MNSSASASGKKRSLMPMLRFAVISIAVLALVVWMILPPMETLRFQKYNLESTRALTLPLISLPDVGPRPVLAFSADGQSAAFISTRAAVDDEDPQTQITVIDVPTGTAKAGPLVISNSRTPPTLEFSRDGNSLAAAGATEVRVWDLRDSREVATITLPDVRLQSRRYVAISPDGTRVATSIQEPDQDPGLWVFECETGQPLIKMERTAGTANDDRFVFHPTENQLIGTADSDSAQMHLCVWDIGSGKVVQEVITNEDCQTLAYTFSLSGNRVAVAMYHGSREYYPYVTTVFELANWTPVTKIDNGNYVFWMALRPDGTHLSLVDGSGEVALWSADSGNRLQNFQLGLPSATAFTGGGALLLVTNTDEQPDSASIVNLRTAE